MRKIIACLLLGCLIFTAASGAERASVGNYVRAYSGGDGFVVWVMRYGPPESQEALVQINGIDHPWDGQILHAKVEPMQSGVKYVVEAKGKRSDVLAIDSHSVELFITGQRWTSMLTYDKKLSEQGQPQAFLTQYLEQK